RLDWSPHPKSMTLKDLAGHVGELARWGARIDESSFEVGTRHPDYDSVERLLARFDENVAASRASLATKSDENLRERFAVTRAGEIRFQMSKASILLRAFERSERRPAFLRLARGRRLDLSSSLSVMGVVNVTPDSFSDGGLYLDPGRAIARALEMFDAGAAIVDVGGESTRPAAYGEAMPIPEEEEIARVLPVIRGIRRASDRPVSIDTRKAAVARAALAAGADLVNDVSALRYDPEMLRV